MANQPPQIDKKRFFLMSRAFLPHPLPPLQHQEPARPHPCTQLSCSESHSNVYSAIKIQPIKGNSLGAPDTNEMARTAGGVYKWLWKLTVVWRPDSSIGRSQLSEFTGGGDTSQKPWWFMLLDWNHVCLPVVIKVSELIPGEKQEITCR